VDLYFPLSSGDGSIAAAAGEDNLVLATDKVDGRELLEKYRWLVLFAFLGCTRPLLPVLSQGEGPNLLGNGRFEEEHLGAFADWVPWEDGYRAGVGRTQSRGAYCHNPTPRRRGIGQRVTLAQKRAAPVLVSGWSRAREVSGNRNSGYSLYVDLIYEDGEELWGRHAPFDTGTHDWQEQRLLLRLNKPIRELTVYGLFRGHSGEAWFDDFAVYEWGGEGMTVFDGVPVVKTAYRTSRGEGTMLATPDGLSLEYDWEKGQVSSLQVDGRELAQGDTPSGFMVRDVAANSGFYGFEDGRCKTLDLRISADFEEHPDHLRIAGKIENTAVDERAITLVFTLPVDAVGWTWHEDVRRSRSIEAGQEYINVVPIGTGATGDLSLYPWATIENGNVGLSLGIDIETPAQYRLGYSAGTGHFFIAHDFALTPETEGFPNRAPFAFIIARTDPEWGFRAAARKYYEIFPDGFARRSKDQGIWMPFTDVSTVAGWEDFGFKYHEGINNVPFDDKAGILSFRYSEPSTWWMPVPEEVPRTHEGVMQVFAEALESDDPRVRRRAQAIKVSGSHDAQGRPQYRIRREPWCDGAVFSSNPSPHVPGDSEARMRWNEEIREALYGEEASGEQDGEYLDSVEGYVTADENFRREHFRHVQVPLTFSSSSKKPVIHKSFAVWEFARWLAGEVRGMGKLMFGNAVPHRFAFLAPCFDIMGTETGWLVNGKWRPPDDGWFNFKRAMSYQKPYLLLMNTDYDQLAPELVERYFQRCLFYGMYPSMFSHNAAEDPYWETPRWYERDRHLFKRYIPLIKQVAQAGWEPVTGARADNPRVWVERFGPGEDGEVFISLFNASEEVQETRLRFLPELLGTPAVAVDLRSGEGLACREDAGGKTLNVALSPEQVRVLRIKP